MSCSAQLTALLAVTITFKKSSDEVQLSSKSTQSHTMNLFQIPIAPAELLSFPFYDPSLLINREQTKKN